jgi:hypothetical protein
MPPRVRAAMLRGIDENEIIVGAYVDNATGGICPMLAAHRNGGRINFGTFARAWDAFTGVATGKPRPATERELGVLRSYLESSQADDGIPTGSLAVEVREVKASRRRLAESEARESAAMTVEQILSDALAEEEATAATQTPRRVPLPAE